mmetsp:Transcript_20616/g.65078  ORF Transcript_20616/g.65078 Transcript_20616/m.65078 type:complete len:217 (-) Transcript_20616:235-885(-)
MMMGFPNVQAELVLTSRMLPPQLLRKESDAAHETGAESTMCSPGKLSCAQQALGHVAHSWRPVALGRARALHGHRSAHSESGRHASRARQMLWWRLAPACGGARVRRPACLWHPRQTESHRYAPHLGARRIRHPAPPWAHCLVPARNPRCARPLEARVSRRRGRRERCPRHAPPRARSPTPSSRSKRPGLPALPRGSARATRAPSRRAPLRPPRSR